MSERIWVSAHLFYHADQDAVIAGLIKPAAERLQRDRLAEGYFFLRYWDGGPHVRFRVLTDAVHEAQVRALIESAAAEFFAATPSTSSMTQETYVDYAAGLARLERLPVYDTELHADNTLDFIEYVPEVTVFGSGRALVAAERQMMASSALAVELIARGRKPGQRTMDAFTMMAVNRTVFTDILPELAYQTRFLVESRGAGSERLGTPEFESHYEANKAALRSALEAVWAVNRGSALADSSVASRWSASVRELTTTLVELELLHTLDADPGMENAPADVLEHINHLVPQLIVERCMHLMCNRLGITQGQESHLRLLLTRTAFDLFAV